MPNPPILYNFSKFSKFPKFPKFPNFSKFPKLLSKSCAIGGTLYAKRKGANLTICSFEEAATYSPT